MIMHCPHAVPNCSTCENSAAARELRGLRRVCRAAKRLLGDPTSTASLAALRDFVEMAEEATPSPSPGPKDKVEP